MPFDATDFRSEPVPPGRPRRPPRGAAALVIILSLLFLVTPFSLAACSDLAHYLRGH